MSLSPPFDSSARLALWREWGADHTALSRPPLVVCSPRYLTVEGDETMNEEELKQAYRDIVTATSGNAQTGVGHCPAHDDKNPSFQVSVVDEKLLVKCHAGCEQYEVIEALDALGIWPHSRGLTLKRYAEAKMLKESFLKSIGVTDFPGYFGKPAIRLTYYSETGQEAAQRFRCSLGKTRNGDPRFRWKKGAKVCLYGLENLQEARLHGYVVMVEGESDCHTLWYHDQPALGIPGADMWKERWASQLDNIPIIYLVVENDAGGEKLLCDINRSRIRDRVRVIQLGEYKDPSGLYLSDVANFSDRWEAFKDKAVPISQLANANPAKPDVNPKQVAKSISLINLDDVEEEDIDWLWEGRIPYGKVSLLDGEPGLGKSTLTIHIASRLSLGLAISDNPFAKPYEPIPSLFVSAEDDLADTVRPRVKAAGGNAKLIWSVPAVPDGQTEDGIPLSRLLTLPDDLGMLKQAILANNIRFVVIDPLTAFLSGQIDSHKDQDVRRALFALSETARETGAAILIVRHLNKSVGASAINRGGGSIAIIGAARSAMVMAKDPDDNNKRVLAQSKSNIAKPVPALMFRLESDPGDKAAHIVWEGISNHSADSLVNPPRQKSSAMEKAMEFISEALADGAKPSNDVEEAATAAGISRSTYDRARNALKIKPKKGAGHWTIELPEEDNE